MAALFCGLIYRPNLKKTVPVPLKSVAVHAQVRGWTVAVTADLSYQNTLNEPIECQFVFPLSDKSAVYHLEADIAGKKLVAECRSRKEAQELYKEAVKSGQAGVLLESQTGSPDVFRILLGNLPANGEAKVTIGYVQPAERDVKGNLSFTLPMVLNPRYVPMHMITDAEKMKEQFHFRVPYVAVSDVSYTMSFDAVISLGANNKIADVKSENSNDVVKVTYENEKGQATVALDGKFTMDHDFGLSIVPADPWKPTVFIEPGREIPSGSAKNWLSFDLACAWFEPKSCTSSSLDTGALCDEYWFVIDRSGSMDGNKIENAKTALVLFVKSLPGDCKFNVIGFGSSFTSLFPEGSVNYSEDSVTKTLDYATTMAADMGGTEILKPLEYIYAQRKSSASGARQFVALLTKPLRTKPLKHICDQPQSIIPRSRRFIVLLTDGEVENTEQVINLARKNASTTRVFTVGIGEGASTALVNGLARVSGGLSEFVRNSNDKLQAKVISLLKATTNPAADNLTLSWDVTSGGALASKMPENLPTAAYQGRPLMQYALIDRHMGNNVDGSASLKASIAGVPVQHKLNFGIASSIFSGADDPMPLHRLAAKARLQELTDEIRTRGSENVKNELVTISVATGVLCEETALVAVDKTTREPIKDSNGRPRFVDIERPTVYGRVGGGMHLIRKKRQLMGGELMGAAPTMMASTSADLFFLMSSRSKVSCRDPMEILVRKQNLDGSWTFGPELVQVASSSKAADEATLQKQVTAASKFEDAVAATLLGLAILRNRFGNRCDEWELIERKALAFLLKSGSIDSADKINELVEAVAKALAIA